MAQHISPWQPEQDRIRLAVLGKLIEECNELSARAARCIIHGLDKIDPDTGRLNSEEMSREASDVEACLEMLEQKLGVKRLSGRVGEKYDGFRKWHFMIDQVKLP